MPTVLDLLIYGFPNNHVIGLLIARNNMFLELI